MDITILIHLLLQLVHRLGSHRHLLAMLVALVNDVFEQGALVVLIQEQRLSLSVPL